MPSNYHQPDVEEVEDEYDAARRYGIGLTAGSGWTAGSDTSANPFVFDDDDDETLSTPPSSRRTAYPSTSAHPPISSDVYCLLAAGSI